MSLIIPRPNGHPVLERFNALALSDALNHEIGLAVEQQQTHILLNMGLADALNLSKVLRWAHEHGYIGLTVK